MTDPLVIDLLHLERPHIIAAHVFVGTEPLLVDPGPTSCLPHLEAGLAAHGLQLSDIRHVLLTHIHLDHAGATGTIIERNPQAHVYVHEKGARHMINPERLMQSATRLYGDKMDMLWGVMQPIPADKVTTLAGGETLQLGNHTVRVYDAPGHAPHHLVYFDEATGAACVGDNAGIRLPDYGYTTAATPPPDIDLEGLNQTLDVIASLQACMLLLTHFGRVDNVAEHIANYRQVLQRWASFVREGMERGDDDATQIARLRQMEMDALPSDAARAQYQQAAPTALSYHGMLRYWQKRLETQAS
ncbi:MAG: MBL fold metallo-hydrolase [Chloroflexaceae bacterium]|jgi:glyoxylase-like metal-dependent hydrolase (beta-lactamase superfamily II)|nr:MBL fold metallo-hydrolase [Chloroflexaceae bacterium]